MPTLLRGAELWQKQAFVERIHSQDKRMQKTRFNIRLEGPGRFRKVKETERNMSPLLACLNSAMVPNYVEQK